MIHALVQVFAGALYSGEHGYTVAAATPTHERKQSHMDKPDPYAELSAVMQDLTAQGVPEADIIDAAFRLAVTLPPACISPLINSRDRFRHTACRSLWLSVAQYAVPLVLGLDFINGLVWPGSGVTQLAGHG
jgi:hypothetical protein